MASKNPSPVSSSLSEVASSIVGLHGFSSSLARNAYSAMLLVPGFQQLRFAPLLGPFRKMWNQGAERYAAFWDPTEMVKDLAGSPLKGSDPAVCGVHGLTHCVCTCSDIAALRARLIIVCRLLGLLRSIDLSRVLRAVSFVGDAPFILLQRTGWKTHKWEQIVSIPGAPRIWPWNLIQRALYATPQQVESGGA